jgi:Ca2+-binding EF-hand superfamily protein
MSVTAKELRDPEFIKEVSKMIFESIDVDDSGYLDRDEMRNFLFEYFNDSGISISESVKIEKIIKSFDINKDNKISFEEFYDLIKLVFEEIANTI